MQKAHEYLSSGVTVIPASPSPQDVVEIKYDGLLPRNGATEVYAHVSFDRSWNNVYDYKMTKVRDSFVASVHLPRQADSVNICFRDAANNWDNNSGQNYSINVNKGYYGRFDSDLGKAFSVSKDYPYDGNLSDNQLAMLAGSEWC